MSFRFRGCFHLLIIIVVLVSLFTTVSQAQNESGTRPIDIPGTKAQGFYYDSTFSMMQVQFPIIRSIPPINTGMPFDVILSYIYVDSLLRFRNDKEIKSTLMGYTTLNDTLTWAGTILYRLTDYNPFLLKQYDLETVAGRKKLSNHYKAKRVGIDNGADTLPLSNRYSSILQTLTASVYNKIVSLIPPTSYREAYNSLLSSNYVLRIKVLSIDSTRDKYWFTNDQFAPDTQYVYQVTAKVIDTLKGRAFKSYLCNETTIKQGNTLQEECPIIKFHYTKRTYSLLGNEGYETLVADTSALLDGNGKYSMKMNKEYVVFLNYANALVDEQYDYFDLSVEAMCSLGALSIENNVVHDINKIWSASEYVSYSTWKASVNTRIQNILNRTY
jgi:hypothetical protein